VFQHAPSRALLHSARDAEQNPPPVYTVREFAELWQVTPRTVRQWVHDHAVEAQRIGAGPRGRLQIIDVPTPRTPRR